MSGVEGYRSGDHWVICDECGWKVRASQTRKRWDGLRVCIPDYEARHPQDFVRGRTDRQRVDNPRPDPAPRYIDPNDVTADDL